MKPNNDLKPGMDYSPQSDSTESVEDFIRELEHLEEDLNITAELKIEVSESDFDDSNLPDFIIEDLKAAQPKPKSAEVETALSPASSARLKNEITELEKTINKFKAERNDILERSRRQAADFENFRKRTDRESHERLHAQMENLARKMLPVLDNLDRAMDFASAMTSEKRAEIEPFFEGILLVNRQIHDVMIAMGVQPIVAVGHEFDPNLHEAVAIGTVNELPPNTVSEEMLRGYRMGNRVIRHSMVKVTPSTSETGDRKDGILNKIGEKILPN